MKIALLTDVHIGCRNDSEMYNKHLLNFFEQIFFPYLTQNNINTVIHLGDLFDRRKYINFSTLKTWQSVFEKLNEYDTHLIIGNHDCYYKDTNRVNSPDLLLKHYDNIKIYKSPKELDFDQRKILFLPWINDLNRDDSINLIESTEAKVIMGHLEIKGFELMSGVVNDHGFDSSTFQKFDKVYSGHFHKRSNRNNIYYLGSPCKITWADHGNSNGFYIFDTDTCTEEFVENKTTLFEKIYYSEENEIVDVSEKYVKIIVKNKNSIQAYLFEKYLEKLNQQNPIELLVIEEDLGDSSLIENQSIDETKDTLTILRDCVNSSEIECDKNLINVLLSELYTEAINKEN